MNLQQFGEELRQLRQLRGPTQEQLVEQSQTYESARSLRKIESGELRPKRLTVIKLLVEGLDERDARVINRFLELSGYGPLQDRERIRLGIPTEAPEKKKEPERATHDQISLNPPISPATIHPRVVLVWKASTTCCLAVGVALSLMIRNGFILTTSLLYSILYAVSIFLESTYQFRGSITVLAAMTSFSLVWASSLAALRAETATAEITGLWIAIAIFMLAAASQWLLVRPALSSAPNVPARFQTFTGRTAHLKNTGYFLIFVFSFWALPVRCVLAAPHHPTLCPPLAVLWGLLVAFFPTSLIMAYPLLSRLRQGEHFDLYLTLFLTRAILGFFLSATCVLWYSSASVS